MHCSSHIQSLIACSMQRFCIDYMVGEGLQILFGWWKCCHDSLAHTRLQCNGETNTLFPILLAIEHFKPRRAYPSRSKEDDFSPPPLPPPSEVKSRSIYSIHPRRVLVFLAQSLSSWTLVILDFRQAIYIDFRNSRHWASWNVRDRPRCPGKLGTHIIQNHPVQSQKLGRPLWQCLPASQKTVFSLHGVMTAEC